MKTIKRLFTWIVKNIALVIEGNPVLSMLMPKVVMGIEPITLAAIIAGTAALGSTAMSTFGGKGGGGGGGVGDPTMFDQRNPDQKRIDAARADLITKYLKNYVPGKEYEGERVAEMSPYEQQGMGYLQKYLDQPLYGRNTLASENYLNQTLTGGFDPKTSEYYRALRDEQALNERMARDKLYANLGSRHKFFSSEMVAGEADMAEKTNTYLNKIMMEAAMKERDRQDAAVRTATVLDKDMLRAPLERTQAATQYGALPRDLQQAALDAAYNDFIRKQNELGTLASGTAAGGGQSMGAIFDEPVPKKSFMDSGGSQLMNTAVNLALMYAMSGGGGGSAGAATAATSGGYTGSGYGGFGVPSIYGAAG